MKKLSLLALALALATPSVVFAKHDCSKGDCKTAEDCDCSKKKKKEKCEKCDRKGKDAKKSDEKSEDSKEKKAE